MKYKNEDLNEIDNVIMSLKTLDVDKELENIEKYWRRFLEEHDTLKLEPDGNTFTLFVDKQNPISNKLYRDLGFYVVEDNFDVRIIKK